jgi:hypothetical protein
MKGSALHLVNGRVHARVPTSPATSELSFSTVLGHYMKITNEMEKISKKK